MAKQTDTKVITNPVRLSYAHVWEPKSFQGAEPKYSCAILVPKEDTETLEAIKAAIRCAIDAGKAKFGGKIPTNLNTPLRDGDAERGDDEAHAGMWFLNASGKTAPGIVDLNLQQITDQSQVYSGCWCRVSLNFFAYAVPGNKGIGAGLNNLQKVRDDDALAGRSKAEDDFNDDYLGEDNDLDSIL
jgi:hypothetical protein